jgi:hypothetical protein
VEFTHPPKLARIRHALTFRSLADTY